MGTEIVQAAGGSGPSCGCGLQPAYQAHGVRVYQGDVLDVLKEMRADWYNCVCTSPPF